MNNFWEWWIVFLNMDCYLHANAAGWRLMMHEFALGISTAKPLCIWGVSMNGRRDNSELECVSANPFNRVNKNKSRAILQLRLNICRQFAVQCSANNGPQISTKSSTARMVSTATQLHYFFKHSNHHDHIVIICQQPLISSMNKTMRYGIYQASANVTIGWLWLNNLRNNCAQPALCAGGRRASTTAHDRGERSCNLFSGPFQGTGYSIIYSDDIVGIVVNWC